MIKLVIFDMDGVLINARELHYEALNLALKTIDKKYIINREEHLSKYDGLPTSKKLNILTEEKELPEKLHSDIWKMKQKKTIELINNLHYDNRMRSILSKLKDDNYIINVASNSISHTIKMMLLKTGLIEYVDNIFSNEDVKNAKPNPEMYLRGMIKAEVSPKETLIIEDSHIGRKAALESGAHLHAVKNPQDVIYEDIINSINKINKTYKNIKPKWQGSRMNVLIPMAGAGSRFEKMGYSFPKPLIDVNGKTMIQTVVENINIESRHIFIVQKEHYDKYHLKNFLSAITPNCEIIQVDGVTEGAACTTLLAKELINNNEPLLMANSDQFVEWDSNEFMYSMIGDTIDAGILTFKSNHPKWSFVKLNEDGFVSEVAEKNPISDIATVGIYYWAKGSDYVKYAEQMIDRNIRVNNEFYVCPVFNQAVEDNKKIKIFNIEEMWGLGTPEDLNNFMNRKQTKY
jgi:HAD superfamily hydrolase (TIGR01509 family)